MNLCQKAQDQFRSRLSKIIEPWVKFLDPENEPNKILSSLQTDGHLVRATHNFAESQLCIRTPCITEQRRKQLQCPQHGDSCRPWVQIHCSWCQQNRWRVTRKMDEMLHWLCPDCYTPVESITYQEWAEQ